MIAAWLRLRLAAHRTRSAVRHAFEDASAKLRSLFRRGPAGEAPPDPISSLPAVIGRHGTRGYDHLADCEVTIGRRLDEVTPASVWTLDVAALVLALRHRDRPRANGRQGTGVPRADRLDHDPDAERLVKLADHVVFPSPDLHEHDVIDEVEQSLHAHVDLPVPMLNLRAAGQKQVRKAAPHVGNAPLVACVCPEPTTPGPAELIEALGQLPGVHCVLIMPQ